MSDDPLDAGPLAPWALAARRAIRGHGESVVPCGDCTACCRSSQFVHIEPDETETLACIPAALLVPAPGRPPGHRVLGYDERGHCPMLVDGRCSIYDHRPRTCRTYDCRIFAATGIEPDQPEIGARVRRWRFSVTTAADRRTRDALAEAVRAVNDSSGGGGPAGPLARAVNALDRSDPT